MKKKIISMEELVKLVDFDKLKKCNAICMKWSKRFKVKRAKHVRLMMAIMKDVQGYTKKLPVQFRSQFVKDCKVMFYANEIEGLMISQFHPMVLCVIKRMHLKIDESEHYESDGLLAIRMATWGYLSHETNASFATYVYNSIFNRIRAVRYKDYEKRLRREKSFSLYSFSDYTNIDLTLFQEAEKPEYCDIESEVAKISEICKLTAREADMLQLLATKEDRIQHWYEGFAKKYDIKFDKLKIRNEARRLQTKVYYKMKENGLLPQDYLMPRMRSR